MSGSAVCITIFSALIIASYLGTNSPSTIWKPVIIENPKINEIECTVLCCKCDKLNSGVSKFTRAGSPALPGPSDAKVIPSYHTFIINITLKFSPTFFIPMCNILLANNYI